MDKALKLIHQSQVASMKEVAKKSIPTAKAGSRLLENKAIQQLKEQQLKSNSSKHIDIQESTPKKLHTHTKIKTPFSQPDDILTHHAADVSSRLKIPEPKTPLSASYKPLSVAPAPEEKKKKVGLFGRYRRLPVFWQLYLCITTLGAAIIGDSVGTKISENKMIEEEAKRRVEREMQAGRAAS